MRISEIQIKNFKSLKNVALTGLKNLVVLIGKNSSGKSNMLDALNLFFNAFNLIEPASIGPITEFDSRIWHDIRIELPIEVVLRIEFNSRECEEIFPGEALKIVRERSPESYNQVIFCRRIVDVKTGWKTEYVKWSDVPIVLNNKLVSPEDFRKSLITPTAEATSSTAFSESAAAKMIGKVASSLHNRVKGNFTLVRVTRDSSERPSDVFERAPIVDSETCEMLRSIGQSRKLEDIKHWAEIEKTFEVFSSMRLDVREGEIYARKNNLYLPMHLIGGGDQEVLILKRLLMRQGSIMAIEEPEMHLHPQLVNRVLKIIKEFSANSQVFLATHSPLILDRVEVGSVWITRMEGKETIFIGLDSAEDMRRILVELDTPLSSVIFAERILLVEGVLEKVILPILAKKIGIDPENFHIVPANLKPCRQNCKLPFFRRELQREYHLRTWIDFSKKVQIPLFLLLYKSAKIEVEKLKREGFLEAQNCAILPTALVNCVPVKTLVEVLNENYGLQLNIGDVDARKQRMIEVEKVLKRWKKLHPGWKTFIAEKMAEKMSKEDIPAEVKVLFENMFKTGR